MKRILAFGLVVFVALFIVGCKSTEPTTPTMVPFDGENPDTGLDELPTGLESDLSDDDLDTSDLDSLDSELDFSWMD